MSFWFLKMERILLSIRYGFLVPGYDGMMNKQKCLLLWKIVNNYKGPKGIILEIGSWQGCSTSWLGVAGKRRKFKRLIAIDLFTGTPSWQEDGINTHAIFLKRMHQNGLDSFVQPMVGNSRDVIRSLHLEEGVSVLHIDGDHEYNAVKEDINNYAPLLDRGGILIIDDYDSIHPDIVRATDELIDSGKFKVTGTVTEIPGKGYGSIALMKIQ